MNIKVVTLLLALSLLNSCALVNTSGEVKMRLEKIGNIQENCHSLIGKEVLVKATYLGWKCPKECRHPEITRSDSCIKDKSGCIYLLGKGYLSPLKDSGKTFFIKGIIELSPYNNTCYIRVKEANEAK